MSYPNAYCVKCGAHTDTQQKHTVILQSNARALKGVCPACASDVYKILPKNKPFLSKVPMTAEERKRFPDCYCVKCQEHTPTQNQHTVHFENGSRAVTGSCGKCGSEVYRILSSKDEGVIERAPVAVRPMPKSPLGESLRKQRPAPERPVTATERRLARAAADQPHPRWAFLAAVGVIVSIAAAFVAYSFH